MYICGFPWFVPGAWICNKLYLLYEWYLRFLECWILYILFSVGPLSVGLEREMWPISAGRQTLLSCSTSGSSPPATITWWREGKLLGLIDQEVGVSYYNTKLGVGVFLKNSSKKMQNAKDLELSVWSLTVQGQDSIFYSQECIKNG